MDLEQLICTECGVDRSQAAKGLGTLLTAVRLAINANEHAQIKKAFPQVDEWLGQAAVGGGRTGEMLALIGPETLEKRLRSAGFQENDIPKICSIVGRALSDSLPEIAAKVSGRLPMIHP